MSMLQQFNEQECLDKAKIQTYKNVQFPQGFFKFMESLTFENLTNTEPKSKRIGQIYQWVNDISRGGIRLETSSFPENNAVGTMEVIGSLDNLTIFHNLLERYDVEYDGATKPEKIELNIQYHEELNPALWKRTGDTFEMLPEVQQALEDSTEAFYEFLELPDLEIDDVILTGSSANYNWTESSDLDLHLVVDMKIAEQKYGVLTVQYFDAKKKVFNDLHDITIKKVPVEFYIQDKDEEHSSTGLYSLKNQEWVVEPTYSEPEFDDQAVKAKAADWIDVINKACSSNKANNIEQLMKKLSKLRQAGLDKGGEFSTENLAFKTLRNLGYLDQLADCKVNVFDRELSIEEEEWSNLR